MSIRIRGFIAIIGTADIKVTVIVKKKARF